MSATPSRWKVRLGPAAVVTIVATTGVIAPATIANAAGHPKLQATTLSIKNKPIAHSKHHADLVSGVLRSHHKGVAGETITLDARTGKKPRWVASGTATTGADGSVSFTVAPTVRTQYKLVFAGDSTHRKSHSNVITVKVVRK
jgi:hypothetical protein